MQLEQVREDLDLNGYAVIDFPDPDLHKRADDIRRFLHANLDWEGWASGRGRDMRCADAWKQEENIRAIAANKSVLDLLSAIYGRPAFPFQTLNFLAGSEQGPHVDIVHFSSLPHHFMCGVWLALEDIDVDAGPLLYYPGSHKWPVLTPESMKAPLAPQDDPYHNYWKLEEAWEAERSRRKARPAYYLPRAGQALIWDANLMHGGTPHRDRAKTRLSQVTHYFFEGTDYYTPLTGQRRQPTRISLINAEL